MLTKSNCKPEYLRIFHFFLLIAGLIALAAGVSAQEPSAKPEKSKDTERIHITSDKLISDTKAKTAEFIGNVRATQGETLIISDRLKIYYKKGMGENAGQSQKESIKKLVATGHVTIEMDDKVAVTEQAVYMAESDTLILTGKNSKITSEKNSVSGDKITLYRKEDRMIVDGSSQERVEAVLYTEEKGIE